MTGVTVVISVMSDVFSLCPPDLYVTVWGKSACKRSHCATPPLWKKRILRTGLSNFQSHVWKFGIFWRNCSPVAVEVSDVLIMCELALWATYMHYLTPWVQPIGQKYRDSQSHTSDRCRSRTESSLPPPTTVLASFNFILLKTPCLSLLNCFYYYGMHVVYAHMYSRCV